MLSHCVNLVCVKPFSFRIKGQRGPHINVKEGDIFWNTTPGYEFERTGIAKLARKGKNMAYAYPFSLMTLGEYFRVAS